MVISQNQYNRLWTLSLTLLLCVQYLRPQEYLGFPNAPVFMPIAGITLLFIFFSKHWLNVLSFSQIRIVLLFVAWMIFLIPFSQHPLRTMVGVKEFIPLLPFIFSIAILINNVNDLRKIIDITIILSAVIAVIGYLTHSGGRYQHFGLGNFLTDPNDYALFMNTMLPVCFFMFMYERENKWKKIFYGTTAVLALSSVIMTYSRGGFLGLLCVASVMWFFSPNRKLTAVIGAVMMIGVLIVASTQWKETVSTSFDTSQSTAQTRLTAWSLSIKTFMDHPIGIGIHNIPNTMYKYASSADNPSRWHGDVNHSFWFTALAEGGVVGFTLIMLLLYHNVRDCLLMSRVKPVDDDTRFIKYFGYAYLGSLVGFCAAGTFLTVNYYPHLWYTTGIIAAGSGVLHQLSKRYSQ